MSSPYSSAYRRSGWVAICSRAFPARSHKGGVDAVAVPQHGEPGPSWLRGPRVAGFSRLQDRTQPFYRDRLQERWGIDVVVPDEAGRALVDRVRALTASSPRNTSRSTDSTSAAASFTLSAPDA